MRKIVTTIAFLSCSTILFAQSGWSPAGDKIKTKWAAEVDPTKPLPEYPRPQLERATWQNLNGLWDYRLSTAAENETPQNWDGKILVPFAVESSLSGVGKTVGKDSLLWYHTTFTLPSSFRKKNTILHFGAVDWRCTVWLNGKMVGEHEGGYDPFDFDITEALNRKGNQELVIRVWDPTSDGPQPRGKQVNDPRGIWYTPVTGIWQTVWLEAVAPTYIETLVPTSDIDAGTISTAVTVAGAADGDRVKVEILKDGASIATETAAVNTPVTLKIENPELWSPDHPFLYDIKATILRKGRSVDEVKSYVGMRKISRVADKDGIQRMLLNNKFLFQYGPLDQGWWPDGLYTAPTDEALRFDIERTKEMGFNMIRKHVKVEPARWYRHCDELGILVWQDMPSGDLGNRWENRPGIWGRQTDKDRTPESEAIYRKEWKEIMHDLAPFTSIVVWVPFNEAWGQFKTTEITEWTMKEDAYRLVNSASGGNFEYTGDIVDLHNYPEPLMPRPELFGKDRAIVLGEFGGLGLPVDGHTWLVTNNWGYQRFTNKDELWDRYAELINSIPKLIEHGLNAAVYTQTTDVENETNGFLTYDREIQKMPVEKLHELHQQLYNPQLAPIK